MLKSQNLETKSVHDYDKSHSCNDCLEFCFFKYCKVLPNWEADVDKIDKILKFAHHCWHRTHGEADVLPPGMKFGLILVRMTRRIAKLVWKKRMILKIDR